MNALDLAAITASVVTIVQLIKWGAPMVAGPLALAVVALVSALGVILWVLSAPVGPHLSYWELTAAWVSVMSSAAGLYGFVAKPLKDGRP